MWEYCKDCHWSCYDPHGPVPLVDYYCCRDGRYPTDRMGLECGCDCDRWDMMDKEWQSAAGTDAAEDPRHESPPRFIPPLLLKKLLGLIRAKEEGLGGETED